MEPLERSLRQTLHDVPVADSDAEELLDRVHAGARRRRRHHLVVGGVAAVAVVTVVAWVAQPAQLLPSGAPASGTSTQVPAAASTGETGQGPVAPPVTVLSVTASSADTFWVLGSTGCSSAGCATIQRTVDGGRTFTRLPAPEGATVSRLATATTISQLRFASDGVNGWAYGGALWSTHDGGRSWRPVAFNRRDRVVALEVWASLAYVVVRRADGTVDLLRSEVTGDAWNVVDTGLRLSDAEGGMALSSGVVTFLARAGGTDTNLISGVNGRWAARALPAACSARTPRISATVDSLWLLCAGSSPAAYSSTDAGATWVRAAIPLPAADVIAARDSTDAVVASSTAVATIRTNGTARTTQVDTHGATRPTYAGFTDPRTGYIIFDNGYLLRTVQGGSTWTEVDLRP